MNSVDWKLIGFIAETLGVEANTVEKWRERKSVPHKWRIRLILESKGRLTIDDVFEEPMKERARA